MGRGLYAPPKPAVTGMHHAARRVTRAARNPVFASAKGQIMSRSAAGSMRTPRGVLAVVVLLIGAAISDVVRAAPSEGDEAVAATAGRLVISEVMTGGASASDEFVELYNPDAAALPLDGLELIYVSASGATVTRKATWGAGAAIGPGAHVLVANEAGVFAAVADATYAGGLAAAGGSLALRTIGGPTAIDAVGWGTAASTWLETTPAPAPAAGSSLERLPGGELGSGQDTDHNLVDFVVRPAPDPQNSGSPPVPSSTLEPSPTDSATPAPTGTPAPTDTPAPTGTPAPTETPAPTDTPAPTAAETPSPTPTATPTSTPSPLTVAEARARPDGSLVVVAGVAITNSDFTEGGGYLTDATAGIAVLVDGATFGRGSSVLISGVVDDRYAQRTIRVGATDVTIFGPGIEPEPIAVATGSVDEPFEGQLVTISGIVQGAPVVLAAGDAFEIDDGSGPVRILVGPSTGIDTTEWLVGASVGLTGVVGQRDSSGTGAEGYRVQPRDAADVGFVLPPPTSTPSPRPSASPSPSASPMPSASPGTSLPALVTIADARRTETGARLRIRGVVTLPTSLLDPNTAVVADPSGSILIRTGSEVGRLARGQLVELTGTRSSKAGMASLRVTEPALKLGTQAEPVAVQRATGAIGEADEATLVVVRGTVGDGPRRTTGGGLSLTINDGSGAVRVFAPPASGITAPHLPAGAWVELRGVVGQETTGAQPAAGYRLWPRDRADVRVIAGPHDSGTNVTPRATRSPGPLPVDPSPVVAPQVLPDLGSSTEPSPTLKLAPETPTDPVPSPASRIPVPLAAGIGGVAGLLTLAWRHGTLRRAMNEIERVRHGPAARLTTAETRRTSRILRPRE